MADGKRPLSSSWCSLWCSFSFSLSRSLDTLELVDDDEVENMEDSSPKEDDELPGEPSALLAAAPLPVPVVPEWEWLEGVAGSAVTVRGVSSEKAPLKKDEPPVAEEECCGDPNT